MEISLFSKKISISESNLALIQNTLSLGVSVLIASNAEIAVICMVVNVSFSLLTQHKEEVKLWFKWDSKVVEHLKNYLENSWSYFSLQFIGVVFVRLFIENKSGVPSQIAVRRLIQVLSNPYYAAWLIFQTCILAPFVEEVIFRGFVQEKIRNIQIFIFGKDNIDGTVHKAVRVGLQGILFGIAHIEPGQIGKNGVIFLFTTSAGMYYGRVKERTGTLWFSTFEHAHWNGASTFGTIFDHFLPSAVRAV